HINVPFEEPLYETVASTSVKPLITSIAKPTFNSYNISDYTNSWNSAKKKLILIGTNYPNEVDNELIESLANNPSVVVMTETTSNLHHPNFVNKIDVLITPFTEKEFEALQPDLLITFGGMVVSKRIKAFLRKYQPQQHWHIDTLRAYDTFGCLTHHIKERPNDFFKKIISDTRPISSNYNYFVQHIKTERTEKSLTFSQKAPYSDFLVFDKIVKALPDTIQLQNSNSSAIRYLLLFDLKSSIEVYCKRGTSGIDGSTSTSVAASISSKPPVVLITGDVGFFYDSNALWN